MFNSLLARNRQGQKMGALNMCFQYPSYFTMDLYIIKQITIHDNR